MTDNLPAGENPVLQTLRDALCGTRYENHIYLVGGYVRDKIMERESNAALDDIDLVLEGSASDLAHTLWQRKVSWHKPVEFPTFGTAMVRVGGTGTNNPGVQVEIVTAREETYRHGSRKPKVVPGTLATDALRRDFTVNTFLENLHTGEITDPTGFGYADLQAGLLRTPLDPVLTFTDDPLRMLRACRFAAKLGFNIEADALAAIHANAHRLSPEHGISFERVRDELVKTLPTQDAVKGLELMRDTGLLQQFAPELAAMPGEWEHRLTALSNLPMETNTDVRLAVLLLGLGAKTTRTVLLRLKFSGDEIVRIVALVGLHGKYDAYNPMEWTDASVRRLIRVVGEHRTDLFTVARADLFAGNTRDNSFNSLNKLQERMEVIESVAHVTTATSPLSGEEIMARLSLPAGRVVGAIKNTLTDAVVAGELAPDDKDGAEVIAKKIAGARNKDSLRVSGGLSTR